MTIAIIKYNAGNETSIANALLRLGVTPTVTDDANEIRAASHVIFPGVGHAKPAMAYLRERELDKVICSLTQPFLGICLGLQLLCGWSEEGDSTCIGVYAGKVRRFSVDQNVPHKGWNSVQLAETGLDTRESWFYFMHSFRADLGPDTVATCDYGGEFSAVMRKGNFLAVQFHPEKSGKAGAGLLAKFLAS